jgi:alkylation response protein AidB-like acyl-CoA dehydrogenase
MSTHMLLLARTEPEAPKHEGISCLLVEMKQPGITVRPLKMITGEAHFNEVFLDDAVTSADWIVGRRGDGWAVTRKTLNFERASVGSASTSEDLFEKLVKLANVATLHGKPAIKDPLIRDELTRIYGMVSAHKAEDLDQIYLLRQGEESRPANAALHKLYNSTIAERIGQLSQRIINTAAMGAPTEDARGPVRWVSQYMNSIAAQIGGGTSNIQRNIIAERALGLPRDN